MTGYRYISPKSFYQGLEILSESKGKIGLLAGGTDLLIRIRQGKETPEALMDITSFGLDYIQLNGTNVCLGATTPLAKIVDFRTPEEPLRILNEAAREVGGVQTRNMATIAGNICTGIPSADMAIPLLVLEAMLKCKSVNGERHVPIDRFFIAPRQIDLRQDEILKEIVATYSDYDGVWGSNFIKLGKKKAMRLAIASAGVVVNINPRNMIINKIRIAMGAVAPTPVRLYNVERFLEGQAFNEKLIAKASNMLEQEISPRTSFRATREYRLEVSRVLFKRSVNNAIDRAIEGVR